MAWYNEEDIGRLPRDADILWVAENFSEKKPLNMPEYHKIYVVQGWNSLSNKPHHHLTVLAKTGHVYTCDIDLKKSVETRTLHTQGEWKQDPLWVVPKQSVNPDANALVLAYNNQNKTSVMEPDMETQIRLADEMRGDFAYKHIAGRIKETVSLPTLLPSNGGAQGLIVRTGGTEIEVGKVDYDALGAALSKIGGHLSKVLQRRNPDAKARAPIAEKPVLGGFTQAANERGDIPLG